MNIQEVKVLLSTPKKIVITSHRNPDGDAIGSALALFHYLKLFGHTINVIFPSEFPPIFEWMPDSNLITIFDFEIPKATSLIQEADIIFVLDYNALDRVDKMGDVMRPLSHVTKIMIDHHREPENFVDYMLSDITASSTSELIYDFILMLGDGDKLNTTIGDCIYTGIITDTGSFKFSTSPKLYRTVAALVELGVQDYRLQDLINNCLPEKNLRLLGHALYNRMEILEEYHVGIIYLSKKDYDHFNIQRGDTEGIVNTMMMLKSVRLACFITEQPTIVKLSLRSKGDFNVQEFCRDHFNGGGHKNASGGYSYAGLKITMDKFKNLLPKYKDRLTVKS